MTKNNHIKYSSLAALLLSSTVCLATTELDVDRGGADSINRSGPGMLFPERRFSEFPLISVQRDGGLIIVQQNGQILDAYVPVTKHGSRIPGKFYYRSNRVVFSSNQHFFKGYPVSKGNFPDIVSVNQATFDLSDPALEFTHTGRLRDNSPLTYTPPPPGGFDKPIPTDNWGSQLNTLIIYNTYLDSPNKHVTNILENRLSANPTYTPPEVECGSTCEFSLRPASDFFPECSNGSTCDGALILPPDGSHHFISAEELGGTSIFPKANHPIITDDMMLRDSRERDELYRQVEEAFFGGGGEPPIQDANGGYLLGWHDVPVIDISNNTGSSVPGERPGESSTQPPTPLSNKDKVILGLIDLIRDLTFTGATRALTENENTQLSEAKHSLDRYSRTEKDGALARREAIQEYQTQQSRQAQRPTPRTEPSNTAPPPPPALTPKESRILRLIDDIRKITSNGMTRPLTKQENKEIAGLKRVLDGYSRQDKDRALSKRDALEKYKSANKDKVIPQRKAPSKKVVAPPKPIAYTKQEKEILDIFDKIKKLTTLGFQRALNSEEMRDLNFLKSVLKNYPKDIVKSAMSKRMQEHNRNTSNLNKRNVPYIGRVDTEARNRQVDSATRESTHSRLMRDKR